MKSLSLIDGTWVERVNANITPEERAVMSDSDPSKSESRKAVVAAVRARSTKPAEAADAASAQAIYDQHKIEGSALIAVDVSLPSGHGIINCRVGGEHKQIRF